MQGKLASGWRLGVWNLVSSQGMQSFLPPSFHSNIYRPHFSLLLAKTYMTPTISNNTYNTFSLYNYTLEWFYISMKSRVSQEGSLVTKF